MLTQIDWDNPQFSYHFKLIHSLRTKVERLFARMKERFKMRRVYKRGVGNICGHVLRFINLLHILANVTGSYGVEVVENARRLRTESASKGKFAERVTFFADLAIKIWQSPHVQHL